MQLKIKNIKHDKHSQFIALGLIGSLVFFSGSSELVFADEFTIPHWLKKTAVWWGEDNISNEEFVSTLQYLIDKKILIIPTLEISQPLCGLGLVFDEFTGECVILDESETSGIFLETIETQKDIVVSLIKLTTLWWGQEKINDQDFVDAIQYLVENNILILEMDEPQKPKIEKQPFPSELIVWPKINHIDDFQIHGHPSIDTYQVQFKLIDVNNFPVEADGTISIVFLDDRNRILYLDAFSVKEEHFIESFDAFDKGEYGKNAFAWEIKTSDIKSGFTQYGKAKLVFTDRYGNNFESDFDNVLFPKFG